MADVTPQPPSTAEQTPPTPADVKPPSTADPTTPPADVKPLSAAEQTPLPADVEPPSTVEKIISPAQVEPPLASIELEKDKDTTLPPPAAEPPVAVEHQSVTVVEKESPLTPATSDVAALAVEQVSVAVPEQEETKPASQPLSAALEVPQEVDPPPETTTQKEVIVEAEKPKPVEAVKKVPAPMPSFKEESNKLSDLSDIETKALEELKSLIQEAITTNTFAEETSIWGIPLMKDDRTDVILLKFLRARDFKAKESFAMLKSTMTWRNKYRIDDELINEELGDDLDKVVFMHGHDKEGHAVCYNVYGEFQNKELYNKAFGDEEKRARFLRWRVQFLERSIRKLDFRPGGVNTIFQVSDLKNSPGPAKRELRIATKQALQLLQDNYPEFVAKQVFINVPWWYLAFYTMISPFLTQRTKSKFVFAGPSRTAETLFKYISPEQVPIQYGGLSVDFCECNPEFTDDDPATEIIVKPATKQTVEIIVHEKCILVWELRVVGWEVSYSAEYVPNVESSYSVMIQKKRKMTPTDEPVVSNSFKVTELGKILLTVNNPTSKKKKMLYRFKVKPYSD